MGIQLYNRLPLEVSKSEEFKVFKLKLFLLDYSFSTLHECLSERQ
jgi:hypothetical protein